MGPGQLSANPRWTRSEGLAERQDRRRNVGGIQWGHNGLPQLFTPCPGRISECPSA